MARRWQGCRSRFSCPLNGRKDGYSSWMEGRRFGHFRARSIAVVLSLRRTPSSGYFAALSRLAGRLRLGTGAAAVHAGDLHGRLRLHLQAALAGHADRLGLRRGPVPRQDPLHLHAGIDRPRTGPDRLARQLRQAPALPARHAAARRGGQRVLLRDGRVPDLAGVLRGDPPRILAAGVRRTVHLPAAGAVRTRRHVVSRLDGNLLPRHPADRAADRVRADVPVADLLPDERRAAAAGGADPPQPADLPDRGDARPAAVR